MRLLHTMIRVNDLEESIKFYCDLLGMKLLRKKDFPSGRFTNAFVGFGSESEESVVELTYNHGYSVREIAEIVHCPVNTVKTRMFHARRRLRKMVPRLSPGLAASRGEGAQ